MRAQSLVLCFLLGACAHTAERDAARRQELAKIDPASEPASPRATKPHDHEELDTEIYLGSRDAELATFQAFMQQINELQAKAAHDRKQPVGRGFHAKGHGCLRGQLKLRGDRDARTRYGIFAGDAPLEVWARFSNGVGWRQDDKTLDARGLALKVMGVPGEKYLDDETSTQDFLMTNSPTPVGRDAIEFMKFAHANAKGRAAGIGFLLGHLRSAAPALLRTGAIDSLVTTQYWSGSAYHLGAQQAVKFTAKPCDGAPARKPSRKSPDYLRADLIDAAKQGICMTFYVQLQSSSDKTPIENASHEWSEKDAPLLPVADLVLPSQSFDSPAQTQFCEELSFNPWHSIRAHEPMGHINRARYFVYGASRKYRHGGHEPKPDEAPGQPTAPASP